MAKTYNEVDHTVYDLIESVMKKHHADLAEHEVTVHAVFVEATDKEGGEVPALKHGGYPAAAKIKITSLEQRARGVADAQMTIDGYHWRRMGPAQQLALIDHELEHLILNPTKEGVIGDDLGRPRLKCQLHDWQLGGFASIVERHGENAIEVQEIQKCRELWEQLSLWPKAA